MIPLRNLNLVLPSISRITPVAFKSLKTGRGSGNAVTFKGLWRYELSNKRVFTRKMNERFGMDTGLDNAMLILGTGGGPRQRKLDGKKRKQLSELYAEKLMTLFSEFPEVASLRLEFVSVSVNSSMTELEIRWKISGTEADVDVQNTLDASARSLQNALSTAMYNSSVPPLKFIGDRTHLIAEEMNDLFANADYGVQYRALSNTGAVLGSMSDTGFGERKESRKKREKSVPKWVKNKPDYVEPIV